MGLQEHTVWDGQAVWGGDVGMHWPARTHPLWNGWPIRRGGGVRDWVCTWKGARQERAGIGLQEHTSMGRIDRLARGF